MGENFERIFISNTYLGKGRSKSFKVKKVRVLRMQNESNPSTIIEHEKTLFDEKN